MQNLSVSLFRFDDTARWNNFIATARNATFLFNRGFMDYHSDRFADFSLVVKEGENWVAVVPAHRQEDAVLSHRGLTYGGIVYADKCTQSDVIAILKSVLEFLQSEGISTLQIKMLPPIYTSRPSDELLYALFLADAKLMRRDSLSVVDLTRPSGYDRDRNRTVRRGKSLGLQMIEETDFDDFWNQILIPNLQTKHGVKPVHTLEEIKLLQSRFPKNIRHFNVYHQDRLVAGTTVFESENVAHPQYISGQEDKNRLDCLDFLYDHLITQVFPHKRYFDFGISNEEQGRKLNRGLIYWKETFGASTVAQDFYQVDTKNHSQLSDVLI